MVSLPDPNQFLGATTKPVQTNLSGAEVASPYVEMAHSLDKAGEAFNSYAIEEAKKAGEAAGAQARVDDNGNIIMDKAPFLVGPAAPEYRRAATISAAAKMEPQIQNKALELRLQHPNDPEGFKAAMTEYQSDLVDKIEDPHLKTGISNMVATSAAQNYRSSLVEANNHNIQEMVKTYTNRITDYDDQAQSIARQGGLDPFDPSKSSNEYKKLHAGRARLYDEMVEDGRIAMSRERADELLKDAIDKDKTQAIIGQAQRLPDADVLEKKQYLYNKIWGPDGDRLHLSPRQRDAAVAEGIKSINVLDAGDREAIADSTKAINKFTADSFHNPGGYSEDVRQILMEHAAKVGDVKGLRIAQQMPIFKDVIGYAKSQPPAQRAKIIDDFTREGILPNGMPISATAPVRRANPNVDPIALSSQGTLGPPSGAQGFQAATFQPGEYPEPTTRGTMQGQPAAGGSGGLAPDFVERIKQFEGFEPKAKFDYKQFSSGYGTRANFAGEPIDKPTAERRLGEELTDAAKVVDKVNPNLDPGTRAALTSLTFNAGSSWTSGALGQKIRAGDIEGAKQSFLAYNRAGGTPLGALATRRAEEVSWFGTQGPVAAGPAAETTGQASRVGQPGNVRRVNFGDSAHMASMFVSSSEELRKLSDKDATAALSTVEDKIKNGISLAPEEASDLLHSAQVSGNQELLAKIEPILTAAQARGLVAPADSAAVAQQVQAGQAGRTGAEYTLGKTLVESLQKGEEFRRAEPLIYGAQHYGTPMPNPINIANPQAALGELVTRDKSARTLQQAEGTTGAVPLIGKQEAVNVKAELTSGDTAAAAAFLTGLNTVSNDNYFATLEKLGDAVSSMSRSNDPARMGAGFNAMAVAWQRNAPIAEHIFKGDGIERMLAYRSLQGFLNAQELTERMNLADDPSKAQARKTIAETVKEETKQTKPEDVAYQIGQSWGIPGTQFIGRAIGSIGAVPAGGVSSAELVNDYKNVLSTFRQKDVPKDQAAQLAAERLKTVWAPSEVGGGVLMKRAPEIYYPKIDGNYNWMKEDLRNHMIAQIGPQLGLPGGPEGEVVQNWKYSGLVADGQTEREVKDGKPPSYRIAYTNAKGMTDFVPGRIAWNAGTLESEASGPQLEANAPVNVIRSGPLGAMQTRQQQGLEKQRSTNEYLTRAYGVRPIQ